MTWFIVGVSVVVGALLMARWLVTADPKAVIRMARWVVAVLAVLFGVFMLFTGRLAWAWIALMALLPWIARMRLLRNLAKALRGRSPGQTSEVRTRFVHMTLSHDTGEMDGEVQQGPNAGRRLSLMTLAEIIDLHRAAVQDDQQSASVLEAYLDRMHGEEWRETAEAFASEPKSGDGHMTIAEAQDILGVKADADAKEIKKAHRHLMQQYHPDKGGSDYLAARINEAKDILLDGTG